MITGIVKIEIWAADESVRLSSGDHIEEGMRNFVEYLTTSDECEDDDDTRKFGWAETSRTGGKLIAVFRPEGMTAVEAAERIESLLIAEGYIPYRGKGWTPNPLHIA